MFKLTKASSKDTGITINTKESFPSLVFTKGDEYFVAIDGLESPLHARATRNGQTLYTGKLSKETRLRLLELLALPSLPKGHTFVNGKLAKVLKSA